MHNRTTEKNRQLWLILHFGHVKNSSRPYRLSSKSLTFFRERLLQLKRCHWLIPAASHSGSSEQCAMENPRFAHVHDTCSLFLKVHTFAMLLFIGSRPRRASSIVSQQLGRIITLILALAKWFLLLLPPGKYSAVQGKTHWAKRRGVLVSRLTETGVSNSLYCQAKPGWSSHSPGWGQVPFIPSPALAYQVRENSRRFHKIISKIWRPQQAVAKLLPITADQVFHFG